MIRNNRWLSEVSVNRNPSGLEHNTAAATGSTPPPCRFSPSTMAGVGIKCGRGGGGGEEDGVGFQVYVTALSREVLDANNVSVPCHYRLLCCLKEKSEHV